MWGQIKGYFLAAAFVLLWLTFAWIVRGSGDGLYY
jgi:hypothetical protein